MENTFLTDAELPATVADWKNLKKEINNIPAGPAGIANISNAQFAEGYLKLNKTVSNETEFRMDGLGGSFRIRNFNGSLFVSFLSDSGSDLSLLNIYQNGTISKIGGGAFSAISDERMKDNIQPFEDGLNKVLSITPKTFQYKAVEGTPTENYPDFICEKNQYGVIAQELETVAPEMVTTGEDGFKSVDLSNLCLLLVNAVKEQNQMILDLTERIEALETPTPQS